MPCFSIAALESSLISMGRKLWDKELTPLERRRYFLVGLSIFAAIIFAARNAESQAMTNFNDERIADAANILLTYIEGSFGALVLTVAGVFAVLSAAFGNYRAALSVLVVAVLAFTLRSLLATFFNDTKIQP